MKCKVCGAFNEDYMEYCEKCAAPLKESPAPAANDSHNSNRGFVRSPVWVKPEFNANTISENDVPADFFNVSKAPDQTASGDTASSGAVCNYCGARLIAGQRFCNTCGAKAGTAPAAPVTSRPAAPQSSVASSAWTGSAAQSTIKYADPIDDSMFSFSRLDDEDDYAPAQKGSKRPAAKPVAQKASRSGRKPASRRRRGSNFNFKPVIIAAGAVAVIGLLVFGRIKLVNGGLFNSSAITDPAVIEQTTTQNGDPAYNITVFAKKNSTVRFEGGSITHDEVVTKKSVIFNVPEQVWVPNEPIEGSSITVTPNITVINKKGESEPVTFEQTITINVPSIDMTVTSPNTEQFSASSPAVEIAGMVGDTSAGIFVNDEPVPVDETGSFSYTYTLTQPGTNTVNVEARKNGYAINRKTFTIEYGSTSTGGNTSGGGSGTGTSTNTGAAQSVYYATTSDVNVRASASASGDKLGSLKLCEKVYVVSADDNQWYKIVYNGGDAYVSGQYIKRVCSVSEYNPTPATISGDDINARAAASTSADKVDTLKNGTSVSLISQDSNGWSLVEYNNRIFYVSSSYVKK